jgi:hypothetical protein
MEAEDNDDAGGSVCHGFGPGYVMSMLSTFSFRDAILHQEQPYLPKANKALVRH